MFGKHMNGRKRAASIVRRGFYMPFYRLMPGKYRAALEKMMLYAGKEGGEIRNIAVTNMLAVLSFAILFSFSLLAGELMYAGLSLLIIPMTHVLLYFMLYFRMSARTSRVEHYLPDMLQLVSANVRSGMTPFQALKFAARNEFADLKKEIDYATAKALGTESFSEALLSMTRRVNSKSLDRVVQLFVSSMKSGANLAKIMSEAAVDLAETRSLKHELSTNTKAYVMFILFIIVAGAPFLLVISMKFLEMITSIQVGSSVGYGMGFLVGQVDITQGFLFNMSLVMLIVTSFSASALMGVIQDGDIKKGLKYFPVIAVLTIAMLFGAGYGIEMMGLF